MDGASNGNPAAQQLMLLSASLAKSAEADSATGASASSEGEKKRKRTGSHAPSPGKTKKKKMEKDTTISTQAMLAAAAAMLPGAAVLLEKQPSLDPSVAIKAAAVMTAAHAANISLLKSGKNLDEEKQKIKQKKATHNATEKRRQARISMQFTELKNVIESASGQTIRRGRGQILAAALLFMGAILQENLTLRNSMNQLLANQQMNQGGSANHSRTPQFTPPMTSQHMLQYHHFQRQPRQPQVHLSAQPPMGSYSQMSTSRSTSTTSTEGAKRL